MNSILEDLYFGEIDPNTQSFDRSSHFGKAMDKLSTNEEKLCTLLEGKEKSMFLDYVNAWGEVNGSTAVDKFVIGFKLGARLMIEILTDDSEGDS